MIVVGYSNISCKTPTKTYERKIHLIFFWTSVVFANKSSYCEAFVSPSPFSLFRSPCIILNQNGIFLKHLQQGRDQLCMREVHVEEDTLGYDLSLTEKFPDADSFNNELSKIIQQTLSSGAHDQRDHYKQKKLLKKENVQKAQDLLLAMEHHLLENKNNGKNSSPQLNIYSYTSILSAWSKCGEAQQAHDLLQRMIDQTITKNDMKQNKKRQFERIIPNTVAFNIVINAWAKANESSTSFPSATEKVLQLLQLMEDQSTIASISNKPCLFVPNVVTYNAVMNCVGKNGRGFEAAQEAESILHRMSANTFAQSNRENSDIRPNDVSFGTVLSAYSKSVIAENGGILAAQKAEELLELMEEMHMNKTISVGPTTFCVNTVMNAWSQVAASSKNKREKYQAAIRAEQILFRMEDLYNDKKRHELRPNTVSYNTVLGAWAKSGVNGAPDRAEAILHKMDQLSKENTDSTVIPDNISFNTVLHAWARSNSKWAAKRAQSILRHMDKLHENGNSLIQPDTVTYATCINAWARAAATHDFQEHKDGILPAKSAEAILRRMEHVYSNGMNPRAKPNLLAYNAVLNAWSKSGDKQAAKHACAILENMEKNSDIQPDVYSFTSAIDACAKAKNARLAETILERMENFYQTTRNLSVKPNIRSYTSVINAYSRSGFGHSSNPEQAESILRRMETMYDSGEHDDLQPDTVCYNAVINAYGWSTNLPNKAEKARAIFLQMNDLYQSGKNTAAKPDIVTCNSVLNACAYTKAIKEQPHALDIAVSVYEMFMDGPLLYGKLNHITYGNMILSCTNLVPLSAAKEFDGSTDWNLAKEKRRKLAETVWWHCCQEGKVSSFVLTKFQDALSFDPKIVFDIVGIKNRDNFLNEKNEFNASTLSIHDLPKDWTRFAGSDETTLKNNRGLKSKNRLKRSKFQKR